MGHKSQKIANQTSENKTTNKYYTSISFDKVLPSWGISGFSSTFSILIFMSVICCSWLGPVKLLGGLNGLNFYCSQKAVILEVTQCNKNLVYYSINYYLPTKGDPSPCNNYSGFKNFSEYAAVKASIVGWKFEVDCSLTIGLVILELCSFS